jgi:3-dehydroquinate synthase
VTGGAAEFTLELPGGRSTEIAVGPGLLAGAAPWPVAATVADRAVWELHGARLPQTWRRVVLPLAPGEGAKEWSVLGELLERLCAAGLERGDCLAAFGGGAALDVGGLAAALYLRGVAWIACPTTLLAMVDAAVGGKTAVNLPGAKNQVGAFHAPTRVLADTELLATLPEAELRSGLGEVLKTALIAGEELLARLERDAAALLRREAAALGPVILACLRTKAAVVAEDEREGGRRAILNLGHTFGHAIEAVAGPGTIPHGVAVAAGLGCALELAERTELLEERPLRARVARTAALLQLPASLDELRRTSGCLLPAPALRRALDRDKKRAGSRPRLVLPRRAGEIEFGLAVDEADLLAVLA